jgi:hypothetical protein
VDGTSRERRASTGSTRADVWNIVYGVIFFCSVAALIASFALGYWGYAHPEAVDLKKTPMNQWPTYVKWQAFVLLGWLVIPPLFFWVEYFGIYRTRQRYRRGDAPPKDWEMFKYAQDISAKIWVAVSTALLIIYFGKDIRLGR